MNAGSNNVITAVNKAYQLPPNGSTNLAGTKSVTWEKAAVEPPTITPQYDVAGNLTNDGVRSYYWSSEGMLTGIRSGSYSNRCDYDGMSRKVRSREYQYTNSTWQLTTDRVFVYDGWNPVCDVTVIPTVTVSKVYVWGLDLSGTLTGAGGVGGLLSSIQYQGSSISRHFFMYDGNGNVVNTVDMDTGAISAHYEYDPFGRLVCKEGAYADENEYRFSTKRYCAAWGLYDYGYRHYSPDLGRWMSRDPMENENLYKFLHSPLDTIDIAGGYSFSTTHNTGKGSWNPVEIKTHSSGYGYWSLVPAENFARGIRGKMYYDFKLDAFSVSLSSCKCYCKIESVSFSLNITVNTPTAGDAAGGVTLSATDVAGIKRHESAHAEALRLVAGILIYDAESECTGQQYENIKYSTIAGPGAIPSSTAIAWPSVDECSKRIKAILKREEAYINNKLDEIDRKGHKYFSTDEVPNEKQIFKTYLMSVEKGNEWAHSRSFCR